MYKQLLNLFSLKEKKELAVLLLIMSCMAIVETLGVASIMPFMALLSNPDLVSQNELYGQIYKLLGLPNIAAFQFFLGIIVLLVIVFTNIFAAYTTWRIQYFIADQNHRFASRLLEHYIYQPYDYFLKRNTTEMGKNVLSESAVMAEGVILPYLQLIAKFMVVCFILLLLLWADPILVLVMGGVASIGYSVVYMYSHGKLGRYGKDKLGFNSARYKMAGEALEGIKDIKILGKESFFMNRFSVANKKFSNITAKYQLIKSLPRHFLEVLAFGGIMIITLYLLSAESDTSKVIPMLSLYALAGYRLMPAVQQIYLSLATIKYNKAAAELINKELNINTSKTHKVPGKLINPTIFEKNISFDNVFFSYDTKTSLFKDLDLSIKKNTSIAFVGETGSGKSTLADLIMALLEPQQGYIKVDGVIINSGNAYQWRKYIGYVPQQIYLLDDTIAANIALGRDDLSINNKYLEDAAKAANIHEFIAGELSEGYQTVIGERGVRLSGGQRQRIGIARALYNNPEVIIFDEATSALDGITESAVMDAIASLSGKKTIIIIAHRLTTVKTCDIIYVLEKGKVIDKGKYDELTKTNSHFSLMADTHDNN